MTLTPINLASVVLPLITAVLAAFLGSDGQQYLLSQLLIFAIFAAGFDLAYGVTGIFSIGHAAFFGGGAYVFALCTITTGLGPLIALACAIVTGAVLAFFFGFLASRTSGIYFALATLALGQVVNILVEVKLRAWTGGSDGLPGVPRPDLFGIDFYKNANFLILVGVVFALVLAALTILRESPFGQVLRAVRDNPVRTGQLGYDVARFRLAAYGISGGVSGLAGALFASLTMFVGPQMLHWSLSGDVLIMTVLGGAGTIAGPLLGVGVFEVTKEIVSHYTQYWYGVLGALLILVTLTMPRGLIGLIRRRARP